MIGFEASRSILEFDKTLEDIAGFCVSDTGRQRLRNSVPISEIDKLREILHQVRDMREIYLAEGGMPICAYTDIRVLLKKIEPEMSFLEVKELQEVQGFLELVTDLHTFHKKLGERFQSLQLITKSLIPLDQVLSQLRFTIEPSGRIYDNASKELKAIRKDIHSVDQDIHQRLERILRNKSEYIQEEYITLREGRLVVPVREFSVSKIPGIVHGQSGSGATYFVEPMPVVELNNEMQKLLAAEHKEIVKILRRLSSNIKAEGEVLVRNLFLLNELDVLQAKARWANEYDCTMPEISPEFYWELKAAKHPILLKMHRETTIPLNLNAGQEFNELIISGPNAGGKTVALKTIGLMQLLFQSGFHIPVAEGTRLPLCERIFAVIGDEQSIEDDLSTFSSHIKALNEVLQDLGDQSLVLIDEIGKGTDPDSGASLSIAFLEQLNRPEIVSIVTTHQNQLKSFAAETEGIQNAAMQFDINNLSPLFLLETGIPGSSYTFEICQRFQFDSSTLNRAKQLLGEESFQLDRLLAQVTEKSRRYQEIANRLSIKESELNSLKNLYDQKTAELKKREKKFEKEAAVRAKELLNNINKEIEAVVREIRESQADKKIVKASREKLEQRKADLNKFFKDEKPASPISIKDLKIGQKVHSRQFGIKGKISKLMAGRKEVEIDREGIKITVPASDLELIGAEGSKISIEQSIGPQPSQNIKNELDLRGLMADEAVREVEAYLDNAVHSEWEEVRLVHGKGTGSLRLAVHKYLSGLKTIKGYRLGKWGEGDTGVTVVQLK
jgi:DNA mismatch repair protein MutS2